MILNHRSCEKPLNLKDLVVEIGFGRGDFLISLARKHPDETFLGFELSGISIEKTYKRLLREGITNVILVQMDAFWGFHFLLKKGAVKVIYLNFPDPWFKKRHKKRRLTSLKNLSMFASKMKKGARLILTTDYGPLVEYTAEEAEKAGCFQIREALTPPEVLKTKYAQKAIARGMGIRTIELELFSNPVYTPPSVELAEEMFPVKLKAPPTREKLSNRLFRLDEKTVLKTYSCLETPDRILIEALLSEEGFVQRFFVEVKKDRGDSYLMDISPFSEIIRTEKVKKAVKVLAEEGIRP
jgi:tRNA (guanine-N7-)-methyltransferase